VGNPRKICVIAEGEDGGSSQSEELEERIRRKADIEALFEGGQRSTSGFAPLKNYTVVYISLCRCVYVSSGTLSILGYPCPT
jgi:hypothetical protein